MASDGVWASTIMDSNQIISLLSGIEGHRLPTKPTFDTYFILYTDGWSNPRNPRLYQFKPHLYLSSSTPSTGAWENINIIVSSHEEHIYLPEMRAFVEKYNRNGQ